MTIAVFPLKNDKKRREHRGDAVKKTEPHAYYRTGEKSDRTDELRTGKEKKQYVQKQSRMGKNG